MRLVLSRTHTTRQSLAKINMASNFIYHWFGQCPIAVVPVAFMVRDIEVVMAAKTHWETHKMLCQQAMHSPSIHCILEMVKTFFFFSNVHLNKGAEYYDGEIIGDQKGPETSETIRRVLHVQEIFIGVRKIPWENSF